MKKNKKNWILLLLSILFIGTGLWLYRPKKCIPSKIQIEPFIMLDEIDSTWFIENNNFLMKSKENCFIIRNYCNTKEMNHQLDSLLCTLIASDYLKYFQYEINIFQESKYTNEKYLKAHPKSLDRYTISHDWLINLERFHNQAPGTFYKTIDPMAGNKSVDVICFDLLEPDPTSLPSDKRGGS